MSTGIEPSTLTAALQTKTVNDYRQQILVLYLGGSDLSYHVIGWNLYDGTLQYEYDSNESDEPIYQTGMEALAQGWNLMHWPTLRNEESQKPLELNYLRNEFVFERKVCA